MISLKRTLRWAAVALFVVAAPAPAEARSGSSYGRGFGAPASSTPPRPYSPPRPSPILPRLVRPSAPAYVFSPPEDDADGWRGPSLVLGLDAVGFALRNAPYQPMPASAEPKTEADTPSETEDQALLEEESDAGIGAFLLVLAGMTALACLIFYAGYSLKAAEQAAQEK